MNRIIKWGAIAGIFLIAVTIPIVVLAFLKTLNLLTHRLVIIYILSAAVSTVLNLIVLWAFKVVGDKTGNGLLIITSYISMIFILISNGYFSVGLLYPVQDNMLLSMSSVILAGAVGIPFGISLLRLKSRLGPIATQTGVVNIVGSICLLTIVFSIFGLIIGIASSILEVVLLFRAAKALA